MRILINYWWLANCGKSKSTQMQLLKNFVNQVFSLNAANGRITKAPMTKKEIKAAMSEMVWTRGIKKSSNCAGGTLGVISTRCPSAPGIAPSYEEARGHRKCEAQQRS